MQHKTKAPKIWTL